MSDPSSAHTPDALLPYQQCWVGDPARVKVCEKSRRIGLTWAEAADDVLIAATGKHDGGMDVWYIGYNKEMAKEYIRACADWSKGFQRAAGEIRETLFRDEDTNREILTYSIDFASGFRITALSSAPSNLRGKQGVVVIDEAAFHPHLSALIKAAMALLIWGGKVRIISSHQGDDSPFNQLIQDCRANKKGYAVHRCTFQEALDQGLFRRICLVTREPWTPEREAAWVEQAYADYGSDADEELDVVPSSGSGAYLSRVVVEACMDRALPVHRLSLPADFAVREASSREREVAEAATLSDAAMRHAAVENDVARFSYQHLGMGVAAYRQEAERAFASEEAGRRAQWVREINDQAAAADRLAVAYKQGSVAALDGAERENQIQAAIKQVGVTAEQAAAQIDKLFSHKWDQAAVQMNRANDYLLDYKMKLEELDKAKATGILTDRAYAEQAKKNQREMLAGSREWSDGAKLAIMDYLDEAGNAAKQSQRLFSKAFQGMEDALVEFVATGKMNFTNFAQSIANDLLRIQIQNNITIPLAKAMDSGGGLLSTIGGWFGLKFHEGGVVGESRGPSALVPSGAFAQAPRLHGGGLAADEVPAILQRGEGVFTPAQMRRLAPVIRRGAPSARPRMPDSNGSISRPGSMSSVCRPSTP
ncbi:MAG: hypothetical protein HQL95_04610 [Magnetococcales bacterium]|nr:hypothetical protein [Magnetococcales bacterium]